MDEVEHHAGQHGVERVERLHGDYPEAARRRRLRKHPSVSASATPPSRSSSAWALAVSIRGSFDALGRCARGPCAARPGRAGASDLVVERLDGEAVIGLRDELLLEIRALEHALDEPAPVLPRGEGEVGPRGRLLVRSCTDAPRDAGTVGVADNARGDERGHPLGCGWDAGRCAPSVRSVVRPLPRKRISAPPPFACGPRPCYIFPRPRLQPERTPMPIPSLRRRRLLLRRARVPHCRRRLAWARCESPTDSAAAVRNSP